MFLLESDASSDTNVKQTNKKKYKCPYCEARIERAKLYLHIQDEHEDLIPEGYTALRVAFNAVNNKTCGHCIICRNETDWNEAKGRYERLCNSPACHEAYKKIVAERNQRIYGTDRLQSDPRYADFVQRKALEGRKMYGKYKFDDGGEVAYMGTYERKLLAFLNEVMHCRSEDVMAPGPSIPYTYEGKDRIYISDFYYIPYNLIIEVKDGGNNPNNHPKRVGVDKERIRAKERAVINAKKFNYVRVTNNNFGQLLSIMALLKFNFFYTDNQDGEYVVRANENAMMEDMSGTIAAALPLTPAPVPHEADKSNYYVVQHPQNNVFAYGITKDPAQSVIYSVDPEHKGFYKAFKTDKNKIDKRYLTFKIKDSKAAKELYDELALMVKTGATVFDENTVECPDYSYIYRRLTNGSEIISPEQLLFDTRFELVKNPEDSLQEMCDNLYKWLKARPIDILEEQVNSLLESDNGENMYNVLPERMMDLQSLMLWKNKFDQMPYESRVISNDKSIEKYGKTNTERFEAMRASFLNDIDPETGKDLTAYPNISESATDDSTSSNVEISHEDWDRKMQLVRDAEAQGLIIMVNTDYSDINDDEDLELYKEKWNKLQSLPVDKRVLSSQTASSILGMNNENLYAKTLSDYIARQEFIKDNQAGMPYPTDDDFDENDIEDASTYFNPGDEPDYVSSSPAVQENTSMLEQLSLKLTNTSNPEKRKALKEQIYNLGWNPEIPFNKEAVKLVNEFKFASYADIQEIDAASLLEARPALEDIPKERTSESLKDKIVPIFVILSKGTKWHSKGIMWFTDSEWSHASLALDSSLKEMYTFTTEITNAPNKKHRTGFAIDTVERYTGFDPHMPVKVYALFITPEQKEEMREAIQWYVKHQDETKYGFKNIMNIFIRKMTKKPKDGDPLRMVCSQFVYTILLLANFRLRKNKDSSLVSPADIDDLSDDARFYVVYQGGIDKYDPKKVDKICYDLLPSLPVEMYGIQEGEGTKMVVNPKSAIGKPNTVNRVLGMAKEMLR